jgi:DNA-binding transcriptional regulator YiaG
MTNERARSLRVAIASHRPERGKRYSPSLKQRIVDFVTSRHAEGASWATIAGELGMSVETLRVWRVGRARKTSRAMVPVRVVAERGRDAFRVVSMGGHHIEGLTLEEAISVLRALG